MIKISLLLFIVLYLGLAIGSASNYRATQCDLICAKSLIQKKPHPQSYCFSYLYPYGVPTKRVTVTASIAATETGCTTVTKTKTSTFTDVFSVAKRTITLPVVTITSYSSSVVVPFGPTPIINKRSPFPSAADKACPTSLTLPDCSPRFISSACSSYPTPTKTITITPTPKIPRPCKTTVTTTETINLFTEITRGVATITPPAEVSSATGVLTTTVPAICAGEPYTPPDDLQGDFVKIVSYPDFPRSGVECCALCYKTKNCAAAAYSRDIDECQFLLVQSGSTVESGSGGGREVCPIGTQDLRFIRDLEFGTNTFPGPCGH